MRILLLKRSVQWEKELLSFELLHHASLRHFSKQCPDRYFKESSIRTWIDKYLRELAKKKTRLMVRK